MHRKKKDKEIKKLTKQVIELWHSTTLDSELGATLDTFSPIRLPSKKATLSVIILAFKDGEALRERLVGEASQTDE